MLAPPTSEDESYGDDHEFAAAAFLVRSSFLDQPAVYDVTLTPFEATIVLRFGIGSAPGYPDFRGWRNEAAALVRATLGADR